MFLAICTVQAIIICSILLFGADFLQEQKQTLKSDNVDSFAPKSPTTPTSTATSITELRIASWNIKVPNPKDSLDHGWHTRKYAIANAIEKEQPDIMGLQEDCYFQSDDLMRDLQLEAQYDRYGLFNRNGESFPTRDWPENVFSNDGLRDGEHNSVWWRRDRFELISTDTFWLSLSPQTPGSSLGEETGRIVNCVILQDRLHNDGNGVAKNRDNNKNSSALAIRFCSTHMPANETLVEKSVPILADQLLNMNLVDEINRVERFDDDQCCNEVVTFVVGDFNTQPNSTSYVLMEEEGFVDLRNLLSPELLAFDNSNVTTTDWYGSPDTMIDYIWLFQNNNTNNRRHSKSLINPGSRSTTTNTNTNRNQFHFDNSGGDVKSYNLGKIPIVVTNVYHLSVRTHGNVDKNNNKISNKQEKTVAEQNHLNTASDHMMIVMDVKLKTKTPSASTRQAPL